MKVRNALVFISSPHRISTYHIDRECSLLLQIRGTKTVSVFDRDDRDVLSEQELERFWTLDNSAATYKPAYQQRAKIFELTPGRAIHIPVNAPHWNWLRRIGLRPLPPRQSPTIDQLEGRLYFHAYALAQSVRPLVGKGARR